MKKDYVLNNLREAMIEEISAKSKDAKENCSLEKIIDEIDFKKLCLDVIERLSDDSIRYFERTMNETIDKTREEINDFLHNLNSNLGEAFKASESLYILAVEAGEDFSNFASNLDPKIMDKKKYLFTALKEIHGRACQQYDEIVCLLENGFADGAMARWRSLYELAVIAHFIMENREETAKSFIDSAFTNDRYDWAKAADCFKNQKRAVSFAHILKQSKFDSDKWRIIYNTSNKLVHASPQGTFDRLGRGFEDRSIIMAGRSSYGLKLPAEAAAIFLCIVTEIYLKVFPNGNSALAISYLNKWCDKIGAFYNFE
ncbi:MAG: DUF5677 domain-containing protein [Clostridium sp.]|nr:DUF5677 domain-containing protein [Clostridium sp.]